MTNHSHVTHRACRTFFSPPGCASIFFETIPARRRYQRRRPLHFWAGWVAVGRSCHTQNFWKVDSIVTLHSQSVPTVAGIAFLSRLGGSWQVLTHPKFLKGQLYGHSTKSMEQPHNTWEFLPAQHSIVHNRTHTHTHTSRDTNRCRQRDWVAAPPTALLLIRAHQWMYTYPYTHTHTHIHAHTHTHTHM